MQESVYRTIEVLCAVVAGTPIGTNLGLVQLLWMLVSGRLLETRGAVIPGLSATGLTDPVVRRAWASLGHGCWTSAGLLQAWRRQVETEGRWQAHAHAGYRPVAVDVTGFWRPRLQGCATRHYHGPAGKALPAIPVGILRQAQDCPGGACRDAAAGTSAGIRAGGRGRSERWRARAGAGAGGRGGHG